MSYSLSFSDLLLVDRWRKAFSLQDKETVSAVLWENGLDVKEPYRINYCQHRNLQGKVVTCERYEGLERCDKSWLKDSGCASLDAWVRSTNDPHLKHELRGMSRESNRSGEKNWDSRNYSERG